MLLTIQKTPAIARNYVETGYAVAPQMDKIELIVCRKIVCEFAPPAAHDRVTNNETIVIGRAGSGGKGNCRLFGIPIRLSSKSYHFGGNFSSGWLSDGRNDETQPCHFISSVMPPGKFTAIPASNALAGLDRIAGGFGPYAHGFVARDVNKSFIVAVLVRGSDQLSRIRGER